MQDVTTDVTVFSLLLGAMIIPEFLKELQSKMDTEIKSILSSEQYAEYLKIKEEKKAARKTKR